VQDGRVDLTNCDWKVSLDEIATATGARRPILVNDFAAVARALPVLGGDDLVHIGGGTPVAAAPKVVLGPGTGLGVASLVATERGGWIVVPGEGGHADLAPSNERELAVVFHLIREFGHVSLERVLSGPGLETLYLALASLDGVGLKAKPVAVDIAAAARNGKDPLAVETVQLFTGWLGAVAGDLALTLDARGGAYIAGGIVPQWGELFDAKLFRRRFEAKGRMRSLLAPTPAYLITARDLAFRGLAALLGD
jgi:glucokinase